MTSRAMHEIQSDAFRLIEIRLKGAIESCCWSLVHEYASQLQEIAQRGLYHQSLERAREIGKEAAKNNRSEREAR